MHRILVVDDDPRTRLELEEAGFETRVPAGGENVLQLVSTWGPELVVLGIGGPELSGLQLLRHIADLEPGIPTVLVTGHPGYSDDFAAWLADAFIVKDRDGSELLQAVRRLLNDRSEDRKPPLGG